MMQSPPMTLEPAPEGRDPNPGPGPGDDYSGSDYRSGRITNLAVGVCAREPMPLPPTPRAPSIKSHAEPNQGPSCPRSGTMTVPCNKGGALLRKAPTRARRLRTGAPQPAPMGSGTFRGVGEAAPLDARCVSAPPACCHVTWNECECTRNQFLGSEGSPLMMMMGAAAAPAVWCVRSFCWWGAMSEQPPRRR